MRTRIITTFTTTLALLLSCVDAGATPPATIYVYTIDGETMTTTTPMEGETPERVMEPSNVARAPKITRPVSKRRALAGAAQTEKAFIIELAIFFANQHQLEPALILAIIEVESSFNPMATSNKGAAGLMQITHHVWEEHGIMNPWDPAANVGAGTAYIAELLARYGGKLDWALAAYNAGSGKVRKYKGPPPFTQVYIRKVLRARERWRKQL